MNKKNLLIGLTIFLVLSCFAFTFDDNDFIWLWQDRPLAPIVLGGSALLTGVLSFRNRGNT